MSEDAPWPRIKWRGVEEVEPIEYTCGYCGAVVGPAKGYRSQTPGGWGPESIAICPRCNQPTYLGGAAGQVPGVRYGNDVTSLPDDIGRLYDEARDTCSVSAYTAAVLTCRKILMNIAVAQRAPEGRSFLEYVEYLADSGYVPPHGKGWVDHIRRKGNEANHEIAVMTQADAEELIAFVEMLLKFIYEFPARVPVTP